MRLARSGPGRYRFVLAPKSSPRSSVATTITVIIIR